MKRQSEISFLNVLFCMIVIFIHIASAPVSGLTTGTAQHIAFYIPWRLSAFVVQGFVFLSAVKLFLSNKEVKYTAYCLKRAKNIIIPYIIAVCIFYIYFVRHAYFGFSAKELIFYILKGDLSSHFYFVIAIVQFYLLKPMWSYMLKRIKAEIAVPLALVIMIVTKDMWQSFLYVDRIFTTYLFYWVAGCYVGKNMGAFKAWLGRHLLSVSLVFFIVAIANAVLSYLNLLGILAVKQLENIHMVYCIVTILFCFAIALKISDKLMNKKLMKEINGASYYIYLIHPLIIITVNDYMARYGITSTEYTFLIRAALTYGGSILICILYVKLKNKLLGGLK